MFIADGGIVILFIHLVNTISAKKVYFSENDVSPDFRGCPVLFHRHTIRF